MPDRAQFWSPVPEWSQVSLRGSGLNVVPVNGASAWLVSGDATPFLARSGMIEIHGPRQICSRHAYALRLAPDRLLVVDATSADARRTDAISIDPTSTTAVTGDSFANCAVTEISDALIIFDVVGESAGELMAQGSEYRFDDSALRPQESASMNFGGFRIIVARRAHGWRLHVERPWAAALWRWLEARVIHM